MSKLGSKKTNRHVFINCPYDEEYQDLLMALLTSLVIQGMIPRLILETEQSEVRLKRLYDLIQDCDYSVHDISRITSSGPMGVPRFNMPFELGMCFHKHYQSERTHKVFVMESTNFRGIQSTSDINGYDIHIHNNSPGGIFNEVKKMFRNTKRFYFNSSHFDQIFQTLQSQKKILLDGDDFYSGPTIARIILMVRSLLKQTDDQNKKQSSSSLMRKKKV